MIRRCPAPLIVLAAALAFALGSQPRSSRADALTSNSNTSNTSNELIEYTLTANQAIAPVPGSPPAPGTTNPPAPQFVLTVAPVSIVNPPSINQALLQVESDTSGYYSQSQNSSQLSVYLGNVPSDGTPITQQALGLSFYGKGLSAGQSIGFAVPFATSVVGPGNPPSSVTPQFTVVDPTTGQPYPSGSLPFSIKFDTVLQPTGGTTNNSGSGGSGGGTITPQGGGSGSVEAPEPLSLLVWSALAVCGTYRLRGRSRRTRTPR